MLLSDDIFKEELKQHIENTKNDNELSNDPQIKWEFLRYQFLKFRIRFSKMCAKDERKQRIRGNLRITRKKPFN